MPELEPFDTRLGAAVHAFADRAQTSVDAAARPNGRCVRGIGARLGWLGIAVPVPVSILIVPDPPRAGPGGLARDRRSKARPGCCVAGRSGLAGRAFTEWVRGARPRHRWQGRRGRRRHRDPRAHHALHGVTGRRCHPPAGRRDDGHHADVDPRVSGTGTWRVNSDLYPTTGPRWGRVPPRGRGRRLGGDLLGRGMGTALDAGDGDAWSCRLTGSGAYDGYSYFFSATTGDPGIDDVRGVIVPGPLPSP